MVDSKDKLRYELRLYPETDADLIVWLAELDKQPHGYKTQIVKETLRKGLSSPLPVPAPAMPETLDVQAVVDRLLPELRPVVEAAVLSALARSGGVIVAAAPASTIEESTASLLTDMVAGLMLEDEG
jgi:hypothetical protein